MPGRLAMSPFYRSISDRDEKGPEGLTHGAARLSSAFGTRRESEGRAAVTN
jgi:hypothetical protein